MSCACFRVSLAVNHVLAEYVAGRTGVGDLVRAVRAAHYGADARSDPTWRALVETIERALPGKLELSSAAGSPGFALTPLEESVSQVHQTQLREAVQAVLAALPSVDAPARPTSRPDAPRPSNRARPPLWRRIVRAVGRLFGGRG